MRRLAMVIALLAVAMPALAAEQPPHELSGVLTKTAKHLCPYQLELDGLTGTFFLRGDVLQSVPPGTRVWVKGRIKTELFKPVGVSPFPVQWLIFMDVTDVRAIDNPFDIRVERKRQNRQVDGTR